MATKRLEKLPCEEKMMERGLLNPEKTALRYSNKTLTVFMRRSPRKQSQALESGAQWPDKIPQS